MSVDNENSKRSLLENINKITNTDTLTDFAEKCNGNFTAIVKNGGGPKGVQGDKGDQGNPTKPKVPIHVWKKGVDYTSETQTQTGFEITYEDDILSNVKYQENHLILLENAHVYKLVLDKFTLKPEFVFELPYFNPDDIKKTNLHIACADSYDGSEYVGFKVVTNTFDPIQKPYVGICIDDDEDSESLNNQYIYNWIYIGGFGSGPGDSGGGSGDSGGPGDSGGDTGGGKCIYVTLSNDNGNFIYSDSNELISGPVSTIARLEINGEPVNNEYVDWSYSCPLGNAIVNEENINNGEFVVNGIFGDTMSSSLIITATYNKVTYPKVFSLRKYINESTYDINPTITTLTLLDTSSKPIDIYFQIKETTTNNKHIYYPRNNQDRIFDDGNVLNLYIELIRDTELVQLEDELIPDIVKSSNNDSVYYYKLTINDVNTLKNYNTLRININKNSSDFKEFEDISIVSLESSLDLDISAGFKSTVFTRSNTTPDTPRGGTWDEPRPTNEDGTFNDKWSDGIPEGIETLWSSWKIFKSNDNISWSEDYWSKPKDMVDTSSFEVIFSMAEDAYNLNNYTPPDYPKYKENMDDPDETPDERGWTDDVVNSKKTLWMATATCNNGVWSQWNASYIKGEKGDNGTSISIEGSGRKVDVLPTNNTGGNVVLYTDRNIIPNKPWIYLWNDESNRFEEFPTPRVHNDSIRGYTYIIDGYLYVWDGDSWEDCGEFKGEKGDNTYLHIKYANDATNDEINKNIAFQRTIDGKEIWITPTNENGEVPGKYIGICTSTSDTRPNDPEPNNTDYKWHKWNGEDGWGYDYIYCLTQEHTAPYVPNTTGPYVNNPSIFGEWKDDPQDVTEGMPYCWVCYSQFMNGAWTSYRGNSKNSTKGVIWSKWSKDGDEGTDIRLDLDNQNDFLIYDNSGKIVPEGATVSTIAKLYKNGKPVEAKFTKSDTGCNSIFENYTVNNKSIQAKVVVKELFDGVASGYVTINATYDKNVYSAKFSVKKLISQNKYQLIVSPTAISYDDGESIKKEVTIQVRKTDGSTGESAIMEYLDNNFKLCYKLNSYNSDTNITYKGYSAKFVWDNSLETSNIQILLKEVKDGTEITWDSEDIPVFKGGKTGKSGKIPYYAGVYSSSDTYQQTDTATPYVFYNSGIANDDNSGYYLLISDSSDGYDPTNDKHWLKMDQFEAIYSNVGVIKQALVGGAVFNKDWIFSQNGCKYTDKVKSYSSAADDYYMEEGFNLYNDKNITAGINHTNNDWKQTNRQLLVYNDDNFKIYNSLVGEPYTYSDILKYKPANFPIGSEILAAVCTGYYVPYNKSVDTNRDLYINLSYDNINDVLNNPKKESNFCFIHIGSSNELYLTPSSYGICTWNTYPVYAFYYDDVTARAGCVKARRFVTQTYNSVPDIDPENTGYDTIKINDTDKYYVHGIKDSNNNVKLKWQSYLLKINKTSNDNYSEFDPSVKDIRLSNNFSPYWAVNLKTGSMWTGGGSNCMLADGSGSLAGGKISWDTMGNLYLPPTGTLSMTTSPDKSMLIFTYYIANGTSLTPNGPINAQIKINTVSGDNIYVELFKSYGHGVKDNFPFSGKWYVQINQISEAISNNDHNDYDKVTVTLYIDNMPSQELDITKYVTKTFVYSLDKGIMVDSSINIECCGYILNSNINNPNNKIELTSINSISGSSMYEEISENSLHEKFNTNTRFDDIICIVKLSTTTNNGLAGLSIISVSNVDFLCDFGNSLTYNSDGDTINIKNGDLYYIGIKAADPDTRYANAITTVRSL